MTCCDTVEIALVWMQHEFSLWPETTPEQSQYSFVLHDIRRWKKCTFSLWSQEILQRGLAVLSHALSWFASWLMDIGGVSLLICEFAWACPIGTASVPMSSWCLHVPCYCQTGVLLLMSCCWYGTANPWSMTCHWSVLGWNASSWMATEEKWEDVLLWQNSETLEEQTNKPNLLLLTSVSKQDIRNIFYLTLFRVSRFMVCTFIK